MDKWEQLADGKTIEKTVSALKTNGIEAFVVESGEEARKRVLGILPEGAEVMTMSSVTLDNIGLSKEINGSDKFNPIRDKLYAMDRNTQHKEMKKLGTAHEWAIGSVHAVTEDGKVLIASASGSQLPAYAYGAGHVIWVVGIQKIVKNLDEGIKRIYEHVFPLENERAKKTYGVGSAVNKILIVNAEARPERITLIFVKERLGF